MARIDKRLAKIAERQAVLNDLVLEHAADHKKMVEISAELSALAEEHDVLEMEWLEAHELLG